MKNPKPYYNGEKLFIPEWRFTQSYVRVPHRSRTLAHFKDGQLVYFVCANQPRTLFWVHASMPGYGTMVRAARTCVTRNAELANRWADSVNAGKVEIYETKNEGTK